MPIPADTLHRIRTNDPGFPAVRLSHPGDVSTALTDADIGILVDALQDNTHVTYVCLTGNNITDIGATQLRRLPQTIRTLDLGCNFKISASGAAALVTGTKLEELGIHYTGIREPADQHPALIEAFNGNKTLTRVNVLFNKLSVPPGVTPPSYLDDTPVSTIQGYVFRNVEAKMNQAKVETTRLHGEVGNLNAEKVQLTHDKAQLQGEKTQLKKDLDDAKAASAQLSQKLQDAQRENELLRKHDASVSPHSTQVASSTGSNSSQLPANYPSPLGTTVHGGMQPKASTGGISTAAAVTAGVDISVGASERKNDSGGGDINESHQTNCCTNVKCVLL
jgi:hypothetical protein